MAFQKHETTDNWWQCEKCQLTDLSLAYAGNCLRVEGLENRTFDTWPQYLTRVVLIAKDGTDEKELVKPQYARRYDNGDQRDKQLGAGRILYGLSESNKFLSL